MAITWTNYNNGDSLLTIRNAINAFNTATKTAVNTNETDIASNAADIATNTANIATNTADIATNVTDIAALDVRTTAIEAGHTPLVTVESTVTQSPTGLGDANKIQIVFDALATSTDVDISAAGVITFNTTGKYFMRFESHYGRAGSTGASLLVFRYKYNGAPQPEIHTAKLDNADIIVPWADSNIVNMTAADTVTMEILRDSTGDNSGGLVVTSTDWGTVPSCRLIIYKI